MNSLNNLKFRLAALVVNSVAGGYGLAADEDTDRETTGTRVTVDQDLMHQAGGGDQRIHFGSYSEKVSSYEVLMPVNQEWDRKTQRRFKSLAVHEALGTLTADDLEELEQLDSLRERKLSPPSGTEVLRQYRSRRITADLIKALTRYVEFHAPTHRPKGNSAART